MFADNIIQFLFAESEKVDEYKVDWDVLQRTFSQQVDCLHAISSSYVFVNTCPLPGLFSIKRVLKAFCEKLCKRFVDIRIIGW